MLSSALSRARTRRGVTFGTFRMKPMSVVPLILLLIIVVYAIYALRAH